MKGYSVFNWLECGTVYKHPIRNLLQCLWNGNTVHYEITETRQRVLKTPLCSSFQGWTCKFLPLIGYFLKLNLNVPFNCKKKKKPIITLWCSTFNFLQKKGCCPWGKIVPHLLRTKPELGQRSWSLRLSHSFQRNFKPCSRNTAAASHLHFILWIRSSTVIVENEDEAAAPCSVGKTCRQYISFH